MWTNDSGYYKQDDAAVFTALTLTGFDCTGDLDGGALTANASGVVSCSDDDGVGTDLAEAYPTLDPTLGSGEVLALDPENSLYVRRATGAANERLIGILSTDPWKTLDDPAVASGAIKVPVALAGRVPVKVSSEGGAIAIGDSLTLSSTPGVARKALNGEALIGYALESLNGSEGIIVAFVTLDEATSAPALLVVHSPEFDANADAFTVTSNVYGTGSTVFRVTAGGDVYTQGVYHSQGADYAEWFYSADQNIQPGEAVCVDVTRENAVTRCDGSGDPNIMGITSTNPAFIGNQLSGVDGLPVPGYVLVGLIGQVPAKAVVENGEAIRPGDSLTAASVPGYVRKAVAGESTVGVALQGLISGEGTINVLISRRNQSLTAEAVSDRVLETVRSLKIEDELRLSLQQAVSQFSASGTLMLPISAEVQRQIQSLDLRSISARIDALALHIASLSGSTLVADQTTIAALESRIAALESGTGATVNGSDLAASTLALEETLVVGRDARIGGDLHLDGALIATELLVPGSVTVDGSLDANTLRIGSGATIGGTLVVQGSLELDGGTLVFGTGSQVSLGSLLVRDALEVMGPVTFQGLARFFGDVEITGELSVSGDQAGVVMIPKSGTSATILFSRPYKTTPVVTASPDTPVLYGVSIATSTGFTIKLAAPADADINFSWHALGVADLTLPQSSSSSSAIAKTPFPVDALGVPLSGNEVWNACIRNLTMLDSEGQPLSCSRYHDANVWHHPDLLIDFTWNTQTSPATLLIPDDYEVTVEATESSSSSEESSESSSSTSSSEESSSSESSISSESSSSSEESVSSSSASSEEASSSSESVSSESSSSVSSEAATSSSSEGAGEQQ